MELPKRKKNRLFDFDYTQNGFYHIVICTKDNANILCTITNVGADTIRPNNTDADTVRRETVGADTIRPKIELTEYGEIAENAINQINSHYDTVFVETYSVMPNHIHILIRIENNGGRMVSAPTVIGSFKRYVSKTIGHTIWQKGFYDHIIRNERDFEETYRYIADNPKMWIMGKDKYYA